MVLSVATYNIHRGVGRDSKRDINRIVQIIGEMNADVIGLQEVESRLGGPVQEHQLNYLAAELGLSAVAAPTMRQAGVEYGNALLSRLPVRESRRLDLSFPGREPRGALDVDLQVGDETVRVITTHFGLQIRERRQQLEWLLQTLADVVRPLTILLVDLNEWVPWSRLVRRLSGKLGQVPAPRTFPSTFPLLPLDRIWVSPSNTLLTMETHRTSLSRVASDHLPLTAKVDVGVNHAPLVSRDAVAP